MSKFSDLQKRMSEKYDKEIAPSIVHMVYPEMKKPIRNRFITLMILSYMDGRLDHIDEMLKEINAPKKTRTEKK